ncbi:MAG: M20 aminoacylase family protein [Gammaproteobacteria bacterium]|nr:M20 aminoacylase family protein [Gammaproteobacteria bacterium]
MLSKILNTDLKEQMVVWRHHLHRHPELSFEERLTSDYIASVLISKDIKIHRGLAGTGIVATIRGEKSGPVIGLRADMDALPITELNTFDYKSVHEGKMHACGHDGHSAMLLGAAVFLKENNNFSGTVHFIFQPAEEGGGGGRVMIEEGLFELFPCQAVYGMHNWPGLKKGCFAIHDNEVMAAVDTLDINVKGRGGHAAMPDQCIDPIVSSSQIINALHSIVSRNIKPTDSAVLSITAINAGSAYNVIPNDVKIKGTLRYFDNNVGEMVKSKMHSIVENIGSTMGVSASLTVTPSYPATINTKKHAEKCAEAASMVAGKHNVIRDMPPSMGSEDFSFILNASEGAYIWIGNGAVPKSQPKGGCMLHNAQYDFNDDVMTLGVSYWAQLVFNILK